MTGTNFLSVPAQADHLLVAPAQAGRVPLFGPGDGCTLWLDGWFGSSWRHCCDAHDWTYAAGDPKIPADLDLALCVAWTGNGPMGLVMLAGVTLFGWLFYRHRKR